MSTTLAPTEHRRRQARRLESEIVKGCEAIATAWIYVAGRLHELDRDRLWEPLG